MRRRVLGLGMAGLLGILAAAPSFAKVLPPPVNQFIGIADGVLNNLTEPQCRACHDNPTILGPTSNVNRHHLLTLAPPAGESKSCFDCHSLTPDGVFAPFRNCMLCHKQQPGQASVHHLTPRAQAEICTPCHGALVQPVNDNHYVPTYPVSLVTPRPALGTGPGGQGGCEYCHAAGTDTSTGVSLTILGNQSTHHLAGFGLDLAKCNWCHDVLADGTTKPNIRRCEACHGVKSLHSIQVSSTSPAVEPPGVIPSNIVVGGEAAGYGHIGNNWDCNGCHGFSAAAGAPLGTAAVPSLANMSTGAIPAGKSVSITLEGAGFVTVNGATYTAKVVVEDDSGFSVTIDPTNVNQTTITFTVPALRPGNYTVAAVVEGMKSNPASLSVVPLVKIVSAKLGTNNLVTITGQGFDKQAYYANAGTGFGVTVNGQACDILSWSDSVIMAASKVPVRNLDPVTVKALFGTSSAQVAAPTKVRKTR